jgi:hypothetical protein
MSSIVIAGDVSGTCTLQAANAAGTTVLSLPTTSGTLVATNGSPTFVTVTSTTDNTTTLNATTGNIATVTAGLGNASAPSITFTGDTNTGIFSPTADTIAFTEGGTESMRIDSSGNVNIGTTGYGNYATTRKNISLGEGATISAATSGGDPYITIASNAYFSSTPDWKYVASDFASSYEQYNGTHVWSNAASGTAGNTITFSEQMRLTAAGLLQFNSGYGSVATAYGCRAWVKFNGTTNTGGFCTINGSGGVTSISDDGTGSYTMNFSFTMPDINYSVAGVSSVLIGTSETIVVPNFTPPGTETASTTTSFKFCTLRPSLTTPVDVPFVYLSVFR